MNKQTLLLLSCLLALGACDRTDPSAQSPSHSSSASSAVPATLKQDESGHYSIYREGEPYFIRGAGGTSRLKQLAEAGANSVRTWSTDDAERILDEAQAQGLTVMLGLSMGKERHGFDYSDKQAVEAQKERLREQVLRYRDHPALLSWGIGNELDLFYTDTAVWHAVEDIARMIRELDPHHLITTVTAGIDRDRPDPGAGAEHRLPEHQHLR